MSQPRASASFVAASSEKKGPIGFVGRSNAGSSRSTITWLNRAAMRWRRPHTPYSAIAISEPSCPSVMAPRLNSGISGTSSRPISCWIARLPTCGPLPCTTTTRQPASSNVQIGTAIAAALARCSSYVPR